MELSGRRCIPCEGGVLKLSKDQVKNLNCQLKKPWNIIDKMKISKQFNFTKYSETINFVNKIAKIAEKEGHHPVLLVSYSKVEVYLWTHAIMGLSANDFILAAKIDDIPL